MCIRDSPYMESGPSEDTLKRELDSLPYFGIVKTPVSRFYLVKLSFSSKVGDFKTRFRDLFRRI